jgi:hypothetical protein
MKRLLTLILVSFCLAASAQYNNSWIDYSKTYYKFKVVNTGLYHISQATLAGIGLGSTPAEQFQLWRNGEEVRLYTSSPTGPLGGSGYIEFWGVMNDGKKDTRLYHDPAAQLSDYYSLETDTAAYFLTVNPTGNSLRFTNTANNVAGNSLPVEPYFMNKRGIYYKDYLNNGYAAIIGFYVYSSTYDIGEGWTSREIYGSGMDQLNLNFTGLNLYSSGPSATFKTSAAGVVISGTRNFQGSINGNVLFEVNLDGCSSAKPQANVPLSLFTNTDNISITLKNILTGNTGFPNPSTTDRLVVGMGELTYPSTFNFNGQKNFSFELPATAAGNFLVIDNFNSGSAPVLMDFSSGNRYIGDLSVPGKVRFALPPSGGSRQFILVNDDASNVTNVLGLVQRNFVNYSVAANQGDYLIISNPILYTAPNYVDQYRQYRSSLAGGNYNSKVCDVDQLNDQFAFGIKTHPSTVKEFIKFAAETFPVKPKYVFIIGKGTTYEEYWRYSSHYLADQLNLVPTFGFPGSDILLASDYSNSLPLIPIGRLTCITPTEISNYLDKIKEYEAAQNSTTQTIANKGWMKNVLQLIGGHDQGESASFSYYMNGYKAILEAPKFGGHVEQFIKSSSATVELANETRIAQLFNEGLSIVGYFGHSSATLFEFNLSSPYVYQNAGKYPFFNVSGCTAGNVYTFDTTRISGPWSLSEQYVLAKERGAIGFLASSHLGIPPILDVYNTHLFHNIADTNYQEPIGKVIQHTIKNEGGDDPNLNYLKRLNLEELNLNGDPALMVNAHSKPDYVEEDQLVQISPSFISVADGSFTANIKTRNIGRTALATDSITWRVRHIYPPESGKPDSVYSVRIKAPYDTATLVMTYPIIPTRDKGLNKIQVTIDADNNIDELSESNNTVTKEFFIYEDEARPVYPYNFAIITTNTQKLIASTANPLSPTHQYVMQMDTSERFNPASPKFVTRTISSSGGILEFDPGVTYNDSLVYYWRVGLVPASGEPHWNTASFMYKSTGGAGFNQSHYFQHLKSDTLSISLDTSINSNRQWKFGDVANTITGRSGVFISAITTESEFAVEVNAAWVARSVCGFSKIVFTVLSPINLKGRLNNEGASYPVPGQFGSDPICEDNRKFQFEYDLTKPAERKLAAHFLDSLPTGDIVVVRNVATPYDIDNRYADTLWNDSTTFGSHDFSIAWQLYNQGFSTISNYTHPLAFIFMFQKNTPTFGPSSLFSEGITDPIRLDHPYITPDTLGYITSPKFGPARAWKQMHWRGHSIENPSTDLPTVSLLGIKTTGVVDTLLTVGLGAQDVDISTIDATIYPYLQLRMRNLDSINVSPYQLDYWSLNYDPVPEGAIAANLFLTKKDTLEAGEDLNFGIAFKNISPTDFSDSIQVKAYLLDQYNVAHLLTLPKQRKLISGAVDTLRFTIATKDSNDHPLYTGNNMLYVEFNPDNLQPEQYHFNNFLYTNFSVKGDRYNPLLDVTFDGVHILNRDIVSAKPHITIKLKDESKYLLFNSMKDTSLLKVQLRYPDPTGGGNGELRTFYFNNPDTMKFTPAISSSDNTATIELTPTLHGGLSDDYQLVVTGKDLAGNPAGNLAYTVDFIVVDKPMISNLLNYPNPFTTSTAFVFTITGSELPTNLKIQILTITGKVVREITKNELGPLHIGRNITEYKWDGTDQYGQKLGNGVYLYRFVTNMHGQTMDKLTMEGDNTDKYFTKGYGKMYLMR